VSWNIWSKPLPDLHIIISANQTIYKWLELALLLRFYQREWLSKCLSIKCWCIFIQYSIFHVIFLGTAFIQLNQNPSTLELIANKNLTSVLCRVQNAAGFQNSTICPVYVLQGSPGLLIMSLMTNIRRNVLELLRALIKVPGYLNILNMV